MSWWLVTALWTVAAAVALTVFITLVKGGQPLRRAWNSTWQGLGALLAVNAAGVFTGVSLGINAFTAACCAVLGVPGVVALLVLKTIFQIG